MFMIWFFQYPFSVDFWQACWEDINIELSRIFDIQEKQAAAKAPVQCSESDSELKASATQRRLMAFKDLSVASFARDIAAVYAVCFLEIFVPTQLFEIVKQKKQGCRLHEDTIRRYLSVVQGFNRGDDSPMRRISERVDCSVREFFNTHELTEKYDANGIRSILRGIRSTVERAPGASDGGHTWICRLALCLLKSRTPRAVPPTQSLFRPSDDQLRNVLGTTEEVLQSELFAEALADSLDRSFALLEEDMVAAAVPPASPGDASPAPLQVALAKLAPAASNLFARILEPRRPSGADEARAYGACALPSPACSSLFAALTSA